MSVIMNSTYMGLNVEISIILFLYFATMTFFVSLKANYLFWTFLEVNTVVFILFMMKNNNKPSTLNMESVMIYFLVQTLMSLAFLYSLMTKNYNSLILIEWSNLIICLISMSKAGAYPLTNWIYKASEKMKSTNLVMLLTFQKIPLMILMTKAISLSLYILLLINLVLGSVWVFVSDSIKKMIISSSIYNIFWFVMTLIFNAMMFLMSFMIYSVVSLMMSVKSLISPMFKSSMKATLPLKGALIMYTNSPPVLMFFIKLNLMMILSSFFNCFCLVILMTFILASTGYLKVLKLNMISWEENLNWSTSNSNSWIYLIFLSMMPQFYM